MASDNRHYDVIVLGGGFTGAAAAAAAARLGKKVLLIEESGALGGAAVQSLVFPFMPYTTSAADDPESSRQISLSRGFFEELVRDLEKDGQIHNGARFNTEAVKLLLDQKMEEAGVDVLFHATLSGIEKHGNTISALSVIASSNELTFSADRFIDCTGDADLAVMAGVPTRLGRDEDQLCQPMTLCFRVGNVDKERFYHARPVWSSLYDQWKAEGKIKNPREDILVFDYPIDGVLHFNTTRIVKRNPVDPFDLSRAEMEGRRQVKELMDFFKANQIPGMENAALIGTASSIGVRESRMIRGAWCLTGQELVACTKFDDAIAAGNYDIDIHNPEGSGTSHYYFPQGSWYTIPYRSLTPKEADCCNLLTAGRCISVDHEAQASIRIIPICTTTGEAAGVAASVSLDENVPVQQADVRVIQKTLADAGAFLGIPVKD